MLQLKEIIRLKKKMNYVKSMKKLKPLLNNYNLHKEKRKHLEE
jgi:hypothetical protein